MRSWGFLGATFKPVRFRIDFLIDFERQKGAKKEAFGEPKWSQNQSKTRSKFKSEKVGLGNDLGRSWVILGGCRRGIFVDFLRAVRRPRLQSAD